MKVKSLLALTVAAFATTNLFASTSELKILSHKEFNAPNTHITYKAMPLPKFLPVLKGKEGKIDQTIQSSDKITSFALAQDGGMVSATGYQSMMAINETSQVQLYTVTRNVCLIKEDGPDSGICSKTIDMVAVEAGDGEGHFGTSEMTWSNVNPGDYYIVFSTSIQNTNSTTEYSSYDVQRITVPAGKA